LPFKKINNSSSQSLIIIWSLRLIRSERWSILTHWWILGRSNKASLIAILLPSRWRICCPNHSVWILCLNSSISYLGIPDILIEASQLMLHIDTSSSFRYLMLLSFHFISNLNGMVSLLIKEWDISCLRFTLNKRRSCIP